MPSSALVENLENRRLLHAAAVDVAAEATHPRLEEVEIVLSANDIDPIIHTIMTAPETIPEADWPALERAFVVPESFRGATQVERPGNPQDVLPADQFDVMATGNLGYFSENYAHLNVERPHVFGIGHAETVAEIDFNVVHQQLQWAVNNADGVVILDIEHLKVDRARFGDAAVEQSMEVFQAIIDYTRAEFPEVEIGFYAVFPVRDYWTPIHYRRALNEVATNGNPWWIANVGRYEERYLEWQASNDFLAPIAAQVDVIYPSLYTFSVDPQEWTWFAEESIKQAERYGKPVKPFLWNRYHNGFQAQALQQIDSDFWRHQLDTVRELAAGVVLWDYTDNSTAPVSTIDLDADYTSDNAWYNETVDFFQTLFDEDSDDPVV